ncbi:uncharacterized protein LOC111907928 [Lactuca sativa]|uniref:Avr9/Cf-9 rapidly elicited protein 146 n=1 Tax=Lactuca sativa TaxID=4236 RepID=A0A9R1XIC9_LACSA|nr:uncharacterized protein LOC111907928 [Lactuca sativa]KAJ0213744.1 hypothetical protein LSAT_V11C400196830 [Lactuca sativa]
MEQNLPVLPKKVWNLVRVVYFMLRKGISKRKLLLDLNMMIKRGKIAGKALQNLMFHHHNNRASFTTNHRSHDVSFPSTPLGEYEFSCSNSPALTSNHPFSLFSFHKKHHSNSKPSKDHLDMMAVNAVFKAMEMIHSDNSSPALPGFGSTPMVRQLRVTDSPFPLSSVDEDNQVNDAAEQFISRFYHDLRVQNTNASFGSS